MSGMPSGATVNHHHFEPTPEGWEAFRRAIKSGLQPVIGTAGYHLRLPSDTRIKEFGIDSKQISIKLSDGRTLQVPLFWFPILQDATEGERQDFEIDRSGKVIWFNALNTELLVDYLFCLKTFADEAAFLNMCASKGNLLNDIASLVWRFSKDHGITTDNALEQLKDRLTNWPPPV